MKLSEEIRKASKDIKAYQPFDVDQEWTRFKQNLDPVPVPERNKGTILQLSKSWLFRAASVLLIVLTIFLISRPSKKENTVTSHQSRDTIRMVEGSVIYLGTLSNVTYPIQLKNEASRILHLNGKATFEVAHHELPFVVECGDLLVTAIGTIFSLDQSDTLIEIVNIRGLIGVTVKSGSGEKTLIKEGETYHFQHGTLSQFILPVSGIENDLVVPSSNNNIKKKKNIPLVNEKLRTYHAEDIIKYLKRQYPHKVTIAKKTQYNKKANVQTDLTKGLNSILLKLTEQTTLKTRAGKCPDCIELYNE